jgi:hypothetical protein
MSQSSELNQLGYVARLQGMWSPRPTVEAEETEPGLGQQEWQTRK